MYRADSSGCDRHAALLDRVGVPLGEIERVMEQFGDARCPGHAGPASAKSDGRPFVDLVFAFVSSRLVSVLRGAVHEAQLVSRTLFQAAAGELVLVDLLAQAFQDDLLIFFEGDASEFLQKIALAVLSAEGCVLAEATVVLRSQGTLEAVPYTQALRSAEVGSPDFPPARREVPPLGAVAGRSVESSCREEFSVRTKAAREAVRCDRSCWRTES